MNTDLLDPKAWVSHYHILLTIWKERGLADRSLKVSDSRVFV